MATKRTSPKWSDVKAKLADFDRAGLLGLVQNLYAVSKDNQTFLHTRLGLGGDPLEHYKTAIKHWLWPGLFSHHDYSVAKAKKLIADYKKAIDNSSGLAELMVFYCEQAAGFSNEVGLDDASYYSALVTMFEQALKVSVELVADQRDALFARLDAVRWISHNFGYGVGDDMDGLLVEYGGND